MSRGVRTNKTKAKAQRGEMALGALLTYHSPRDRGDAGRSRFRLRYPRPGARGLQ